MSFCIDSENYLANKQVCGITRITCLINRCVVWCGVVGWGGVWYGMVWYDMVWYGMVWYGMVWHGKIPAVLQSFKNLNQSQNTREL